MNPGIFFYIPEAIPAINKILGTVARKTGTVFIKVANIALGFVGQKELIRRDFYGFFVFWFI